MKAYVRITILVIFIFNIFVVAPFARCEQDQIENITYGMLGTLFNNINLKDAQVAMEVWVNELSKVARISAKSSKTIVFSELPDLINAVRNKQVDLVGIPSLHFLQIKDKIPLEPALAYSINDHVGTEYVLIVPKDKEYHGLSGLKNKKILIHKHDDAGLIPVLWLNSLLRQQGLPPADRFCASIKKVDLPSQAVLPVFFQQADCCVVSSDGFEIVKELNPQLGEKLVIVDRSPFLLVGLLAYRRDLPANLKKEIKEVAVNLASYPRGKQILTLFKIGAFRPFQSSDFDPLLELIKDNKPLLSVSKSKSRH